MSPSWEPMDCSLPGSSVHWISQNTGIGYFFLFQGIFLTLGSNQYLLDWQADFLPLSHQGSPRLNIGSGLPRMSQVMPIILHLSGLFCPQFSMFKKTQHYYKDCKKKGDRKSWADLPSLLPWFLLATCLIHAVNRVYTLRHNVPSKWRD